MGWASGSGLMSAIIAALKPRVPDEAVRRDVYVELIREFQAADCDTLMAYYDDDPVYAEAYAIVMPYYGGYQAASDGKRVGANPYPAGSHDASEWAAGWDEYHADHDHGWTV